MSFHLLQSVSNFHLQAPKEGELRRGGLKKFYLVVLVVSSKYWNLQYCEGSGLQKLSLNLVVFVVVVVSRVKHEDPSVQSPRAALRSKERREKRGNFLITRRRGKVRSNGCPSFLRLFNTQTPRKHTDTKERLENI